MSQTLDNLIKVFRLSSLDPIKIKKANRKTLLKWFSDTRWQHRIELHSQTCARGKKKSKVVKCMKGSRPMYSLPLNRQSTKKLREILIQFLKDFKLTNIKKLRKSKIIHAAAAQGYCYPGGCCAGPLLPN